MDNEAALKWIKTASIAAVGGGVAAAFAAACDPSKYRFPQDFGSGKLWPFFFQGAGMMFIGMLLKSPVGQKVMTSFKQSQAELQQSQADIASTKAELKSAVKPPEPTPPTGPPPTKKP